MTLLDPRRQAHSGLGCRHGVPWAGRCQDCQDNIAAAEPRLSEATLASLIMVGVLLLLAATGGLAYLL